MAENYPPKPGTYVGTAVLWQWWGSKCATSDQLTTVEAAGVRVRVRREAALAVIHLLLRLRRSGAVLDPPTTGAFNCRRIRGSGLWSLHGLGTAVDISWNANPYGTASRLQIPAAAVADVQELRLPGTNQPLWAWGGHWYTPDGMHWQINCRPSELGWVK
jgi:hypothetical protein